jgi:hypothetical protein
MIKTTLGDVRLVIPPGESVPEVGNSQSTVPTYEVDVEDYRDIWTSDLNKENQGGNKSKNNDKGKEDNGVGNSLEKELKEMARSYAESISSQMDERKEEMVTPENKKQNPNSFNNIKVSVSQSGPRKMTTEELNIFKARVRENMNKIMSNSNTRPESLSRTNTKEEEEKQATKGGTGEGLGGEWTVIGYSKPSHKLWKESVKSWIGSILKERKGSSWLIQDRSHRSVISHMKQSGSNVKLKSYDVRSLSPEGYHVLVFIDVSGSVFNTKVQADFKGILMSYPTDTVEMLVWTFDGILREGPLTPKQFRPMSQGEGGTCPWSAIASIIHQQKYSKFDGVLVLTDGEFGEEYPAGLVSHPRQWCFILTQKNSKDFIPPGCKIIEAFTENSDYWKKKKEEEENKNRKP